MSARAAFLIDTKTGRSWAGPASMIGGPMPAGVVQARDETEWRTLIARYEPERLSVRAPSLNPASFGKPEKQRSKPRQRPVPSVPSFEIIDVTPDGEMITGPARPVTVIKDDSVDVAIAELANESSSGSLADLGLDTPTALIEWNGSGWDVETDAPAKTLYRTGDGWRDGWHTKSPVKATKGKNVALRAGGKDGQIVASATKENK